MANGVVDNVVVVVCRQVPVLTVLVSGGWLDELYQLRAVLRRVRSKLPVLVIRQSGGAADFIADAVDRDDRAEERSVFQQLYRCLH